MKEPNIPNDSRDWNSIDIFLFSNGQEYSPPRKYHLQSDDLKWWDNTKTFLARSQYGSMHSAIDIYSLDGKKIESPLELKNASAYVAVIPPDAFIPAGYEKYLFKASRSWEKRQGKLSNSNDIDDTVKTKMYLDITTIEQIEEIVSLRMDENSVSDAANKPEKAVEPSIPKIISAKLKKSYPKKNSSDSERTFVKNKNISNSKFNKNDNSFIKTKNTPFKPQKCNNKQPISSKYSRCSKLITRVNSNESKTPNQMRTSNLSKLDNKMYDPKINNSINYMNENTKNVIEHVSTTDQNVVDSIHQDAGEKLVDNNTTNQPLELSKTGEHFSEDRIQKHLASASNNKGKLDIQLRIKLEDFPNVVTSENCNHLEKERSYVTFITKEMASQVNIDVILGKEIFKLNNNLLLNRKSIESNITKTEDQDVLVQCTCDKLFTEFVVSNESWHKNVPKLSNADNDVLLESCCKCNKDKIETIDRGIQKSLSSCSNVVLNSTKVINRDVINIPEHSVPVLNDDSRKNRIATATGIPLVIPKTFEDKSVQTEWYDVLLQAKCHEDGRYSFHLPPLSILKQYNIDQI